MQNFIVRPETLPILYIPNPKCAHTSVLSALFYIEHREWFDDNQELKKRYRSIHGYYNMLYKKKGNDYMIAPRDKRLYKFVVVRDPVERFISVYKDRIVAEKKLHDPSINDLLNFHGLSPDPDINTFVTHLSLYSFLSNDVRQHVGCQYFRIGKRMAWYDRIYHIKALDSLRDKLIELTNIEFDFPRKRSTQKIQDPAPLTTESMKVLKEMYAMDYRLLSDYLPVE